MAEEENMSPEEMAQYQKDNCIFCKLVSGEIPSKKIYEDTDFVGILDINPATEGHVLLMPKQHFQILPQIPQEIVGKLGIACSNISAKIIKSFKCEGTSIFIANGAVAGQRAPHFMVHIMPRKEGDGISLNPKLADIDDRLFNTVKNRLLSSMKVQRPQPQESREEQEKSSFSEEPNSADEVEEETEKKNEKKLEKEDISKDEENDFQETELEQEHRLKKERDKKRELEKSKSLPKKDKKVPEKKQQENKGIDFDKLARMFGK